MSKKYYLTTPIYYVNSAPHLGTAYSTLVADSIRRYRSMSGYDALLVTGSDEQGQNVERAATKAALRRSNTLRASPTSPRTVGQVQYRLPLHPHVERETPRRGPGAVRRCIANGYIYKVRTRAILL